MTQKKKEVFFFRLENVKKINSYHIDLIDLGISKKQLEQFQMDYSINFNTIKEKNSILLIIGLDIIVNGKKVFGVSAKFSFVIKDFAKIIKIDGESTIIPDILSEVMIANAIGIIRGMLIVINENNEYKDFILPDINIKGLIDKALGRI